MCSRSAWRSSSAWRRWCVSGWRRRGRCAPWQAAFRRASDLVRDAGPRAGALPGAGQHAHVPSLHGHTRRGRPMTARADGDVRTRLRAAFAAEERRGLMLASAARSAAVVVVVAWLAYANPERGLAYAWVLGTGALFLCTGLAQLWLYARRATLAGAVHRCALAGRAPLSAALLAPDPL